MSRVCTDVPISLCGTIRNRLKFPHQDQDHRHARKSTACPLDRRFLTFCSQPLVFRHQTHVVLKAAATTSISDQPFFSRVDEDIPTKFSLFVPTLPSIFSRSHTRTEICLMSSNNYPPIHMSSPNTHLPVPLLFSQGRLDLDPTPTLPAPTTAPLRRPPVAPRRLRSSVNR